MLMTDKPANIFKGGSQSFSLLIHFANVMFVQWYRALEDIEDEVVILTKPSLSSEVSVIKIIRCH